MTKEEVKRRIIEIIELSEIKRSELENNEEAIKNEFCSINHFLIYKIFIDEFKELLETEKVMYLLSESDFPYLKNQELYIYIKNELEKKFILDCKKLSEMLAAAPKKEPYELKEAYGYFVPREDFIQFISICQRLKIGPYGKLDKISNEDSKETIYKTLKNTSSQYNRIKSALAEPRYSVMSSFKKGANETIEEAPREDFNEKKYHELSKENAKTNSKKIDNIDDLALVFAGKEKLEINALASLIPAIGSHNFRYLIDKLFDLGSIDVNDYVDFLENSEFTRRESKRS